MTDLKPDVVRLILSDHETFRAKFAQLAGLRDEPQAAAQVASLGDLRTRYLTDSVDATRVGDGAALEETLTSALASGRPTFIEVNSESELTEVPPVEKWLQASAAQAG